MSISVQRPQRWDVPFCDEIRPADVARLMTLRPFVDIDAGKFPAHTSLHDILLNDARIVRFAPGDLIVREGDYGNSAFLILEGAVRVTLQSLPAEMLGRKSKNRSGWFKAAANLIRGTRYPETRQYGEAQLDTALGTRSHGDATRIFLQDVPGVLDEFNTLQLNEGELFGEVSALSRNPRLASVFAEVETEVVEIRWQGLREIMRRDPALKRHVHDLYRENSLLSHLRETPVLANVSGDSMKAIVQATEFESYGDFEWNSQYQRIRKGDSSERLKSEPILCEEEHYTNGLILVRSGFARLSRQYGQGHLTMAYLGKGQMYGFDELVYNWKNDKQVPLQRTLRAVGYVDILRIPTSVMEAHVLPTLPKSTIEASVSLVEESIKTRNESVSTTPTKGAADPDVDIGLLEFIVENRLMNGTQAMVINTDRCTRCDDCVRACAAGHDNNPRFIRHGPTHGNFMMANACMHCADPVCMIGCPTGAIGRDESTGNVLINDNSCIGCSTCASSCPYNNIRMVEIRTSNGAFILNEDTHKPIVKATKCDLCADHWGGPACQNACPHDAMIRVDMTDLPTLGEWLDA
jgi:Fe-S-cluster-containing dehydrogenase component/CRP-like cAMP-binding protein